MVLGAAIECHRHSVIFRRVYPNLSGIILRAREIIGDNAKENKADHVWTFPDDRTIEFGAIQLEGDKTKWQGRAHDLKAYDELPEFTESQYIFTSGWNRSVDPNQRVRVLATGNPPITESGSWVIRRWRAWLDKKYHNPAKPGELRWYATIDGEEQEFLSGDPIQHKKETIYPRSRTFIPASLSDNPFYAHNSQYISVLQSLPEPLRSMLLYGDFEASAPVDPWQVIPTEWVLLAQERWNKREKPNVPLTCLGIDPARGGIDKMSTCKRYDNYFDKLVSFPGVMTTTGPKSAELIRQLLGEEVPQSINIDVIGYGASTYDSLSPMYPSVNPINAADGSTFRDRSGKLKMRNLRAEYYWRMREALDPKLGDDIALPPGASVVADLCAARYEVSASGVLIESKEDIKKRLGRSPDEGESILLAHYAPNRHLPSTQPEQKSKWRAEQWTPLTRY